MKPQTVQILTHVGAACFGYLIGWFVYYINRYRKGDVQFSDLTTLIGIIGGGSVTALFEQKGSMFGAYGIGLLVGFVTYFFVLIILVYNSENFNVDWFLDGRRKDPASGYGYPEGFVRPPMDVPENQENVRTIAAETAAAAAAATIATLKAQPEINDRKA